MRLPSAKYQMNGKLEEQAIIAGKTLNTKQLFIKGIT